MAASDAKPGSYNYDPPKGSVLFQYFLSPYIYATLVEFYPRWLHPNVITALGFTSAMSSAALLVLFSPGMTSAAPPWVYYACSALACSYMILDNTDGKQARRIKASSFVGETLDHGVDTACLTFNLMAMLDCVGLGRNRALCLLAMGSGAMSMYGNHFSHLVTGKMSFGGRFLSVDEAMIAAVLTLAARGWYGNQFGDMELFSFPEQWLTRWIPESISTDWLSDWPLKPIEGEGDKREVTVTIAAFLTGQLAVPAVNDFGEKLYGVLMHAADRGEAAAVLPELLPLAQYLVVLSMSFASHRQAQFETAGLSYTLLLTGALFCQIACALVMAKSLTPRDKAAHRVGTHLVTFIAVFAYAADAAEGALLSCALLASAVTLLSFARAVNAINNMHGGRPMFTVVKV